MKQLILLLTIVLLSVLSQAQPKYTKDLSGNFIQVQASSRSKGIDKPTGKFFTDRKGVRHPIFITSTNRLVYHRISGKTGKAYKVYLDVK